MAVKSIQPDVQSGFVEGDSPAHYVVAQLTAQGILAICAVVPIGRQGGNFPIFDARIKLAIGGEEAVFPAASPVDCSSTAQKVALVGRGVRLYGEARPNTLLNGSYAAGEKRLS